MSAPADVPVRPAGFVQVVGIAAFAAQQCRVFLTVDRFADGVLGCATESLRLFIDAVLQTTSGKKAIRWMVRASCDEMEG